MYAFLSLANASELIGPKWQTAELYSQSRVRINQSHASHITAHSIMSSLMSWPIYP